jgi:hypothetical protein
MNPFRSLPRLMTAPSPQTLERERDKLFVTDAELIRRMGVPEKEARDAIAELELRNAFPRKLKIWGNRRYWPAVKAYLDMNYGATVADRRG